MTATPSNLPWRFERPFRLWAFHVTHNVLLLRSVPTREHGTRVDVMFWMVEALRIVRPYDDLLVDVLGTGEVDLRREFGAQLTRERTVFSLSSSKGSVGLVAAGAVAYAEDDLTDGHPSTLDNPELRDHRVRYGRFEP